MKNMSYFVVFQNTFLKWMMYVVMIFINLILSNKRYCQFSGRNLAASAVSYFWWMFLDRWCFIATFTWDPKPEVARNDRRRRVIRKVCIFWDFKFFIIFFSYWVSIFRKLKSDKDHIRVESVENGINDKNNIETVKV